MRQRQRRRRHEALTFIMSITLNSRLRILIFDLNIIGADDYAPAQAHSAMIIMTGRTGRFSVHHLNANARVRELFSTARIRS